VQHIAALVASFIAVVIGVLGGIGGLRTPQGFMISVFFSVNCT